MLSRSSLAAACMLTLGLAACNDTSASSVPDVAEHTAGISPPAATCTALPDPNAVRAAFAEALFPHGDNAPLFCALNLGGASCVPQSSHLSAPIGFDTAVPSEQTCKTTNSGATLTACDTYAKHLITNALAQGNLIKLLRGVTRLSEVMKRPQVPAWYRWTSPQNPFVQWMAASGITQGHLTGKCTSGSDDAGYQCLISDPAAPKRSAVRGLAQVLHRSNGVRVRNGQLAGASDREAAIFASATAPANVVSSQTGVLAAALGPRVQHPDYLATALALRILDGSAAGDDTEIEALLDLDGYVPAGVPPENFSAVSGLRQAQLVARRWDPQLGEVQVTDLELAADTARFFRTLRVGAMTANALGQCDTAAELAELYTRLAQGNISVSKFKKPLIANYAQINSPTWATWASHTIFTTEATQELLAEGIEECGIHQEYVALTTTEEVGVAFSNQASCVVGGSYTDAAGNQGTIDSCVCTDCNIDCDAGDQPSIQDLECRNWATSSCDVDCTAFRGSATVSVDVESEELVTLGEDLAANQVEDEVMGVVAGNIREAYLALLTSDDNRNGVRDPADEIYDHGGGPQGAPDGIADLDHGPLAAGEQASILTAGVGVEQCQQELVNLGSVYGMTPPDQVSCPGMAGDGVDADCVSGEQSGEAFVPYPIALRTCPKYTAKVIGVLDSDFTTDLDKCATAWSFTQAVEFFLRHSDDELAETAGVLWELKNAATDFAGESLSLSQPPSGMYRHRAAFASAVGTLDDDGIQSYEARAGLDVVDGDLATGEAILGNGIDLSRKFDTLRLGEETGVEVIAQRSKTAFTTCVGGCEQNGTSGRRAQYYRNLREATSSYRELARARLDVQWRRYDGLVCADKDGPGGATASDGTIDACESCVEVTDLPDGILDLDTDGDGVLDTDTGDGVIESVLCNAAKDIDGDGDATECAALCTYYDAANEITETGVSRMVTLDTILAAHKPLAHGDVKPFIAGAIKFTDSVATQLELDRQRITARETDWLGYRTGLWYPALVDADANGASPDAAVNAHLVELEQKATTVDFEGKVDEYLGRVTAMDAFLDNVEEHVAASVGTKSSYCQGGINQCDTDWRDDYTYVDHVNKLLEEKLCNRSINLYHNGLTTPQAYPLDIESCPKFLSPDLDAMDGLTGQLPMQAAQLEANLREVEALVADLDAYILNVVEPNSRDAAELEEATEQFTEGWFIAARAAIACTAAIVTAAISVACTAASAGTCAPVAAAATAAVWQTAGKECAQIVANGTVDVIQAHTQKQLERAYQEYAASLQETDDLYQVTQRVGNLTTLTSEYTLTVQGWQNLVADYQRSASYASTVYDNLVASPVFDPTVQLFFDESLGALETEMRGYAQTARDAHHALQYALGQPVREGGVFSYDGMQLVLPKLSEITVFKRYDESFQGAYESLDLNALDDLADGERGRNLVAYASLLDLIHFEFKSLYGGGVEETQDPMFVGRLRSSMPLTGGDADGDGDIDADDLDRDHVRAAGAGEWAMLGGSPFFDPDGPGAQRGACAAGQIDLRAYCDAFEEAGQDIDDNPCLDVAALDMQHRYDLVGMDTLVRGSGVKTFSCHATSGPICDGPLNENGDCPVPLPYISPWITVAADPDGDGRWEAGELGTKGPLQSEQSPYFAAQTPTVRNVLKRYLDEVARDDDYLQVQDLPVGPGTYLFLVNMSPGGIDPQGYSSPDFDPERDMLYGARPTRETIAEHVTAMALTCLDSEACPNDTDPIQATVVMLGDGFLGDRCLLRSDIEKQERVRFEMGPQIVQVPFDRLGSLSTMVPETEALLETTRDEMSWQPLHTNGWIVALPGVATADGDAYDAGPLTLYRHSSAADGMRLRLALFYEYVDETAASATSFGDDIGGLLACEAPAAVTCVNGTCPE